MFYLKSFIIILLTSASISAHANSDICVDLFRAETVDVRSASTESALVELTISEEQLAKSYEKAARQMLRQLIKNKESVRDEIQNWVDDIQVRIHRGDEPRPFEDLALQLLVRTEFIKKFSKEQHQNVVNLLLLSRKKLLGQENPSAKSLTEPLPFWILEKLSEKDRHFYDLGFQMDAIALRVKEPVSVRILRGIFPLGLLSAALLLSHQPVIAGLAFGGFMLGLGDYVAHRFILHASPGFRKLIEAHPALRRLLAVAKQHFMHHAEMFPGIKPENYALKYSRDFDDPAIQNELIPILNRANMTEDEQRSYIIDSNHGILATRWVHVGGVLGLGLLTGAMGTALGWQHDVGTILGPIAGVVASLYTPYVNANHLPLHSFTTPYFTSQNALYKAYLNTAFYRATARRHYVHHVRSNTNFAVMPFGFDRMMGTYQTISLKDLVDLYDADLIF